MTTEVSEEIRRRIEARRANRSGNTAAAVTPEAVAEVAVETPPAPETPPVEVAPPAAAAPPVKAASPKPNNKRQPVLEPAGQPAVVAEPPAIVEPTSRADRVKAAAEQPPSSQPAILSLLEEMRRGEALVIVREADNQWQMTTWGKFIAGPKPKTAPTGTLPNGFNKSLFSPEYMAWDQEWVKKSFEQKLEFAVELGLNADDFIAEEKDEQGNKKISPLLTLVRLVPAVRAKLGMAKYKPGYETVQQRKDAEARARAGEAW